MATQANVNRTEAAKLLEGEEPGLVIPILVLFLAGVVLGLVLLALAAGRTGVLPLPGAAFLVAGGILSFFAEGGVLGIVAFALTLVGLGWIGVAVLRMSDEQWDMPEPTREAGHGRSAEEARAA
jgi:hypothetical protein